MRKMFLIHYPHLVCACLYWHIVSKDMVIPGVLFYVTDGSTCSTFFCSNFLYVYNFNKSLISQRLNVWFFSISFYLSFCCSIVLFVIPQGNALDVKLLLTDRLCSGCAG